MNADLLNRVPGGALLSALLRLLLASERREEFIGDLVEEAQRELAGGSSVELAWWLWSQTLRSVPALVALRIRRLGGARPAPGPGGRTAVLAGHRTHRNWPLSVALAIGAHLVAGSVVLIWALAHVDEIEPIRIPVVFSALLPTLATAPAPTAAPAPAPVVRDQPQPSRVRTPRRGPRAPEPAVELVGPSSPLPGPAVKAAAGERPPPPAPPVDPCVPPCRLDEPPARLPPRLAEKRCLSCPAPHLPAIFRQLGMEQELLVKSCVDARGAVTSVDVLRGLDPVVDAGVTKTVQGWRFSPHTLDGHPVPFCYTTRFVFAMR